MKIKTLVTSVTSILLAASLAAAGQFNFNCANVPAEKAEHVHSNIVPVQPGKDAEFTIVTTTDATLNLYVLGRSPSENRLLPVPLKTGTNTVSLVSSNFDACEGIALASCDPASLVSVSGTWK